MLSISMPICLMFLVLVQIFSLLANREYQTFNGQAKSKNKLMIGNKPNLSLEYFE